MYHFDRSQGQHARNPLPLTVHNHYYMYPYGPVRGQNEDNKFRGPGQVTTRICGRYHGEETVVITRNMQTSRLYLWMGNLDGNCRLAISFLAPAFLLSCYKGYHCPPKLCPPAKEYPPALFLYTQGE